jgi:hypothetical protein
LGFVGGQVPGGHGGGVGHHGGDDGAVGVAVQELDDHFGAYPGDAGGAKVGPAPGGGYPYPGGAFVVKAAYPIPVELYAYPAILVGVDLLARGAYHQGGLQAVDFGLNGVVAAPGVPGDGFADTGEAAGVLGALAGLAT